MIGREQYKCTINPKLYSVEQMGILFAHERDESNILCSVPFAIFECAGVGFQMGDLRCKKDLVKRDETL